MRIQRSATSNNYCVPAAISALTGLHVDMCETLLKEELGDTPIEGIFYPLILKILTKLNYNYIEVAKRYGGKLYLICYPGHVGVIDSGIYYDNMYCNGIQLESSGRHRRQRIEHIFEVWK